MAFLLLQAFAESQHILSSVLVLPESLWLLLPILTALCHRLLLLISLKRLLFVILVGVVVLELAALVFVLHLLDVEELLFDSYALLDEALDGVSSIESRHATPGVRCLLWHLIASQEAHVLVPPK